jgi:hypothetical protein
MHISLIKLTDTKRTKYILQYSGYDKYIFYSEDGDVFLWNVN